MGKRILVVDDDEHILFVLEHALRSLEPGTDVITATNAAQALEQVSELRVDVVLTDLKMPGQDGISLTDLLRRLIPSTPIIWVTAYEGPSIAAEARRLGVYRCLTKPVELGEIRAAARGALESTATASEVRAKTQRCPVCPGRGDERKETHGCRVLHGD